MGILISHWHCILPIVAIGFFVLKSSKRPETEQMPQNHNDPGSVRSLKVLEEKFASGDITEADYLRIKDLLQQ